MAIIDIKNYAFADVVLITYTLQIKSATGGTTDPPPGTYTYAKGENVLIEAIPFEGYSFDYWEIDGSISRDNPVTLTIEGDIIVRPVFTTGVEPPEGIPLWVWGPIAAGGGAILLGLLLGGKKD